MKRMWKISAAVMVIALFFMADVGMQAFDIRGTYEKAKEKAKGGVAYVKDAATEAKNRVTGAVSSGVQYIMGEPTAVRINPYKNTIARVRVGNELNVHEREFLAKRQPKVKRALEKMLNRSLDGKFVPKIAIVASGGGYRAMLGTIGSLVAVEQIGLLDATTYIAGLSGGTWAIAPWISTGMSVQGYRRYIQDTIQKDIHVSSISEAKNIIDMLALKLSFDEPITTVDIYGGLLANRLLNQYGTDAQRVYLSQQSERIKNADIPYPIYTAIDARQAVAYEPHWFEYTPHEIGSPYFGVYVPSWAYGRLFNNGQSMDFAPEQSLGFLMGTWGSAFGVHFGRAWDEVVEKVPGTIIRSMIEKKFIEPHGGKRIDTSWAEIFNFMFGMPHQELASRKTLKFVDAGIDFNLPYPPVSGERPERQADIMVFLDFSGGSLAAGMRKTEEYARRKGLKFPKIDYTNLEKRAMSIFMDPTDPSVPVVIYFPRVSEQGLWERYKSNPAFKKYSNIADFDFTRCTNESGGFCGTARFKYPSENSEKLINQMEFNIMVHKDEVIKTINYVIDQKS
jgi:phospholipase A2